MPVSSTSATGLSGQQSHTISPSIDPLTCCEVSHTLIPLSSIPTELNLNLNCITVSCSSTSTSSSSKNNSSNSISSSSLTNSNNNGQEHHHEDEESQQLRIITSRIGNNAEGIVKIEQVGSSEEIDDEDFRDNLEKVLNLSRKENNGDGGIGGAEVYSEECDLDFDDFDDILDEDDDYVHCDIVSSTSSANSITLYSGTSDSESSSSRRKRHFSGDPDGYGDDGDEAVTPSIASNSNVEDEIEFLSLENPNALPCLYCQGGKDHTDQIWPIQLDLDLLETLFQLCPDFFDDFDEVEMDPTDLSSSTSSSAIDDPSTSSSSLETQINQSSTTTATNSSSGPESSPPHVQVDDSPLQQSMDRNKESLKVKLLLRRPMNQLVEQGILPPPKTPAAFAGQRVRLERARMGDLLKAKIQQRPARQELIRQHILEDSNARVAPSLAEKQRMLKRARLADSLNDHLIHRPGPLELVQKNILHAPDAIIEQAIKEGVVPFKATSEGHASGPQVPNGYNSEDDSSSDMSSPADTPDQSQSSKSVSSTSPLGQPSVPSPSPTTTTVSISNSPASSSMASPPGGTTVSAPQPIPPPLQVVTPTQQIQNQILSRIVQAAVTSSTIPPVTSAQLTLNKLSQLDPQQLSALMSSMAAQQQQGNAGYGGRAFMTSQGISFSPQFQQQQHASTSKSRSSKKSSKAKSQPKARQIKFHEYKGPPSAHKGLPPIQTPQSESSYELLLQQQQLFLQWQLEWQHKYPQIILPVVSKLTSPTEATGKLASAISAAAAVSMHSLTSPTLAIATNPTVLSPSTISAVSNSGTSITSTISQPGQQAIAPALQNTAAAQTFVFEKSPTTTILPNSSPIPFSVMVTSSSSTPTLELRPTSTVTTQVTTSAFTEILPARNELPISMMKVPSSVSTTSTSKPGTGTPNLNMAKLNDWKVSDLKAELKKRNLPVSGAKPQLIERLKSSDLSLQDESISTTTHTHNTNNNTPLKNNNNRLPPVTIIKNEVQIVESSSTDEMMDVNETCQTINHQQVENILNANQKAEKQGNGNTNKTLNAAMIALLGKNNIRKNGSVIPIQVFNALTKNGTTGNMNTSTNAVGTMVNNSNKGNSNNVIVVDETLIREQQRQIEQLQEALKNSQQQLQQMKLSQQGGGQKHRLALQQHLQHKMQQQALQAELQKLIQLHSLQQQQQQQQKQQQQKESAQPSTNIQIAQISTAQKIQPQKIQISPQQQPQKVVAAHKEVSSTQQQINKSSMTNNDVTTTAPSTIPFAVVQIATATNTHLQTNETTEDLDNIPQLQIPEPNNCAFQIGKNETSQGSKLIPDPINNSDQMDHSWLLKINEVQPEDSDSRSDVVKNYPGLFENIVNESKEVEKPPVPAAPANVKSAKGFKSQMVDDVLEILIRNGELPASAAQEPQTPTTPGKSPRILTYPTTLPSLSTTTIPPPPPPPLPPVTFAVTLPTSITFSRPTTANLPNAFLPLEVTLPTVSNNSSDAKSSTLSSVISSLTHPPHMHLTNSEALTKEAQDILKISEDLSNFGRAHAENESQNRLLSSNRIQNSQNIHVGINDDDSSNALAMLLGDVEKDLHLVDDMDVLDEQSSHDFTISIESSGRRDFIQRGVSSCNVNGSSNSVPMSIDTNNDHHSNLHLIINEKHSNNASDDLLDELGTLLPSDLDVPMPMEMDYSDWLDNLLPDNNNSSSESSVHMNTNSTSDPCNSITTISMSDSDVHGSCNNNNFYGVMMDFNSDQFSQRDPLLSSRSLNIFTSSSMPDNPSSNTVCASSMDLNTMKSINRAPSPMAMGDSGLLWDFV